MRPSGQFSDILICFRKIFYPQKNPIRETNNFYSDITPRSIKKTSNIVLRYFHTFKKDA